MAVWRNKINSKRRPEDGPVVVPNEARKYCRDAGVVGIGWGTRRLDANASVADSLAYRASVGPTAGVRAIRTLDRQVQDGDFMWTRDTNGDFWLGRVQGPCRRELSDDAFRYDLGHVRPCKWLQRPLKLFETPGAVVRSFTGPGPAIRRIKSGPLAIRVTEMIWEAEVEGNEPIMDKFTAEEALKDLLDAEDVEDVVLLFLQYQGWLLMPSTRRKDTPTYEAAFCHRHNEARRAVVSVKSGGQTVPIGDLKVAAGGRAEAYAYSTTRRYEPRPPETYGVTEITTPDLADFMRAHPLLLPDRIGRWMIS